MMTKKLPEAVSEIDPDRIVSYIVCNQRMCRKKLPQATEARNVCCPNCGSKKGFWNAPWDAWGCKEDDCLVQWLPMNSALREGYVNRKIKEQKE